MIFKRVKVLTNFDSKILIQQRILKITQVLQLDTASLVKSQAQKDCSVSEFHWNTVLVFAMNTIKLFMGWNTNSFL